MRATIHIQLDINEGMPQIIGKNGGEDTLAHWPTTSGMMTIDDASCEVLKYLDKIWGSLSSSGISLLFPSYYLCCI